MVDEKGQIVSRCSKVDLRGGNCWYSYLGVIALSLLHHWAVLKTGEARLLTGEW